MAAQRLPETWSVREAAAWCGLRYRQLLDLLATGQLPALQLGQSQTQKLPGGVSRRRRAAKWLIPRQSFVDAWHRFNPQQNISAERHRAKKRA
jgi:hypothetical protein